MIELQDTGMRHIRYLGHDIYYREGEKVNAPVPELEGAIIDPAGFDRPVKLARGSVFVMEGSDE